MISLKNSPLEHRVALASAFCPVIAFVVGGYLLKQKLLYAVAIISALMYGILIVKYAWIDLIKLNICLTSFYYTGGFPYKINKLGFITLKASMYIALFVSPIYVLNLTPENVIDFTFSVLLILCGSLLLWFGNRPKNLVRYK